jgi:hypothetical protein
MLAHALTDYGLALDFGVLIGVTALLSAIAASMYGRMGF